MAEDTAAARSRRAQGGRGPGAPPRFTVRLLGPVDVTAGGREVAPGGRARTMLAALAARAGQVVPADVLTEAIWGDDPPRTAGHALHVHASTLRRLVPGGLPIAGRPPGYVLLAGPDEVDADRFDDLAARGRVELSSGEPASAAELLRAALALWRGPPLAGVPWERFADGEVRRWEDIRLAAEDDHVDALLALGRTVEAAGEAEALAREEPFRERRWAQLMLALYRSGRQADALARYRQARALLAEELGIDPSPELRRLEGLILRQDGALSPPGAGPPAADEPVTRFARGPAGRLAYQVLGEGPPTLVFVPGFGGNVEIRWEQPALSHLYRRLARSGRLVLMDKRGTGLSDRDDIPPVEAQVGDVLAVMDAAGAERAALLGVMDGGAIALLTAAAHPERVTAVATYACFAAFELLGPGAPAMFEGLRRELEDGVLFDGAGALLAPSHADDPAFVRWAGRYMRMAAGVGGAATLLDRFEQLDVRAALAGVTVPVLAVHREGDRFIPSSNARYIAEHVPDGRVALLPGDDSAIWAGDVDAVAARVEAFLASEAG